MSFPSFGKNRQSHINCKWSFTVFWVSVSKCILFVFCKAVVFEELCYSHVGFGCTVLYLRFDICTMFNQTDEFKKRWRNGFFDVTTPCNVFSNVHLWASISLRMIVADLARLMASHVLLASTIKVPILLSKASNTSRPLSYASSSGKCDNNWSFNLVEFSRTTSASLNVHGPALELVLSMMYVTSSKKAIAHPSSFLLVFLSTKLRLLSIV